MVKLLDKLKDLFMDEIEGEDEFELEEEQKEIAALFNASIHEVETKSDMEKAIKETIIRIKTNSINMRSKNLDPTDMAGLMKIVEDKRSLEKLEKLHISID